MKKLKWTLLIAWMILIFAFSSQPAVVSNEKSGLVVYFLNLLGLDLNSVFGTMADYVVRKAAHFSEYFILYLLIYNVVRDRYKGLKALCVSLLGVFIYACSDEIHQLFVPGRAGRITDVLIDTAGGALAMGAAYLSSLKK